MDAEQGASIYEAMQSTVEMSGGSVGNTMAGLASLGGVGSYIGKVRNDQLGNIFHRDLQSIGIEFSTTPAVDGSPTARCLVIVTPDGQRSMATYLGACTELGPEDIDADTIRSHSITYLEGYLWDAPQAMEAMVLAAQARPRLRSPGSPDPLRSFLCGPSPRVLQRAHPGARRHPVCQRG